MINKPVISEGIFKIENFGSFEMENVVIKGLKDLIFLQFLEDIRFNKLEFKENIFVVNQLLFVKRCRNL